MCFSSYQCDFHHILITCLSEKCENISEKDKLLNYLQRIKEYEYV